MREFYPFLVKIEKDIDDPMFYSMPDYTWCGKNRQEEIDAMIGSLEYTIASLSADVLNAYAESLKPHLRQAMAYREEKSQWSNEQNVLVDSHRQLSFSIFALILRAYHSKKTAFNAKNYATSADIEDYDAFSSEICRAAEDGGIFHNPTVAQLLSSTATTTVEAHRPRVQLSEYLIGVTVDAFKDELSPKVQGRKATDIGKIIRKEVLSGRLSKKRGYITAFLRAFGLDNQNTVNGVCKYFKRLQRGTKIIDDDAV